MGIQPSKFTPRQREAAAVAKLDRGMRTQRVADLAREGLLELDGDRVEPFDIKPDYVATLAVREKDRRAKNALKGAAKMRPADSIEAMRRDLHAVAHRKIARMKKIDPDKVDPAQLQAMARAVDAISRISPANVKPVPEPKTGQEGQAATNSAARGGKLLEAMREKSEPVQDLPTQTHGDGEAATVAPSHSTDGTAQDAEAADQHGSRAQTPSMA